MNLHKKFYLKYIVVKTLECELDIGISESEIYKARGSIEDFGMYIFHALDCVR